MSDDLFAQAATYTKQTLTTDIQALSGIRTHDPKNRVTADLHLRPRSHRDRLRSHITRVNATVAI